MSGKLEFGCDYLQIMRNLELKNDTEGVLDPVADAAARLFLLKWGFSAADSDDANKLFWDRVAAKTLENDLDVVVKRILEHIRNDRSAQERLVMELAAVGDMDMNLNDNEKSYVVAFQNMLDMKSSEFFALCKQGEDWAVALNFFGETWAKNRKIS